MTTTFAPNTRVEVIDDNFSHIRCKGWVGRVCEEQPHPTLVMVKFPNLDDTMFFASNEIQTVIEE